MKGAFRWTLLLLVCVALAIPSDDAPRSECAGTEDCSWRSSTAGSIAPPVRPADDRCRVERVTDGDTFVCAGGRRVRLLLIDAPEMQQGPYGARARRELQRLIAPGTTVRLEYDVEKRDRYGRTLAYVYDPPGTLVNEAMLRSGYAVVIVYPPNVQYVERMRAAATDAREAKRGLWATNAFDCTPRDYRRGRCR